MHAERDYGVAAPFMGAVRGLHTAACLIWSHNIAPGEKGRDRLVRSRPAKKGARPTRETGAYMPARRSTNRFQERELARVLRATQKSGIPFDRIEIDPVSGHYSVIGAKPDSEQAASPAASEWDKATEAIKAKQPVRAKTAKRK
jgi:hypothetical protein